MKFGLNYHLPAAESQSPLERYRDTIEQSVYGEALGFESVWPVEQHFNGRLSLLSAPFLMLAAVAERTRMMRLGSAVMLLPLWHPVRLAEEVATLDVLSNGRVEFGVGRGAFPQHFAGFGVDLAESRERFSEVLEIVLQAWTNERLSHHGRFFDIEDLTVVPKPVQQPYPPVRVAANTLETFQLMGRLGYQIFVSSNVNPFPRIKELLPAYHAAREAAGHPSRGAEDLTLVMPLFVGKDHAQVRRELEPHLDHYLRRRHPNSKMQNLTYEYVCEHMAIFDGPDACVERLGRLREEFNMGRVLCWFNPGGMIPHDQVLRSMELFAAKVIPHFPETSESMNARRVSLSD